MAKKLHRRGERDCSPAGLRFGILPEFVGFHLRRAQSAVFKAFVAGVGDLDITPGQFGMMVLLKENPGLKQGELAEAFAVDKSTIVPTVKLLEHRGIIERRQSAIDRRRYELYLTAAGVGLLEGLIGRIEALESKIFTDLSVAERKTLITLLAKIERSAAADPAAAPVRKYPA